VTTFPRRRTPPPLAPQLPAAVGRLHGQIERRRAQPLPFLLTMPSSLETKSPPLLHLRGSWHARAKGITSSSPRKRSPEADARGAVLLDRGIRRRRLLIYGIGATAPSSFAGTPRQSPLLQHRCCSLRWSCQTLQLDWIRQPPPSAPGGSNASASAAGQSTASTLAV
jgi:hypothetical protein